MRDILGNTDLIESAMIELIFNPTKLAAVCILPVAAYFVGGCDATPESGSSNYFPALQSVANAGHVTGNVYSNDMLNLRFAAPDSMFLEVGDLDKIYHGSTELIPDSSVRRELALSTLFIFSSKVRKMQVRGKYQYMYRSANDRDIDAFLRDARINMPKGLSMAGIVVDDVREFVQNVDGVPLDCIEVYATAPEFPMIYRMYAIPTSQGIVTFDIIGQMQDYPARAAEILEGLEIANSL